MKTRQQVSAPEAIKDIRQRFLMGRFPVATVDGFAERQIGEVLGLVVSRGYDSEEAFYGMLARAETKGAVGIIGYRESVSFHPDGSRFYICYGTAVTLRREAGTNPAPLLLGSGRQGR